jgi:hypothetical protein
VIVLITLIALCAPLIAHLVGHGPNTQYLDTGLEVISKRAGEDEDHPELEEGEVVVGLAVAAGGDPAPGFQPRVGAFDGPAVPRLRVGGAESPAAAAPDLTGRCAQRRRLAGAARFADPGLDLACAQLLLELGGGVAAVGPQLVRFDPALEQLIDQRQQVAALVLVAGAHADRERRPVGVYDEVVAATAAAGECARDLRAPFFASTSDASTINRDQSSRPPSANSRCNTTSACANKPLRCHSSSRRRHVSPDGNPNSRYGTCNHGVSV